MIDRRIIKQGKQSGFTLVEISLATIFVAFIITILAATTVSIVRSYNKGIWLAQINTAGQQLVTDISDKSRYSTPARVDNANRRLCVGGVTYIWNTEKDIERDQYGNNYFEDMGNKKAGAIRLARIVDPSAVYCNSNSPIKRDENTRVLLGRGAIIQEFNVKQGIGANESIPFLSINAVISTEGSNRPIKSYIESGQVKIDADLKRSDSRWQCGEWIDVGPTKGQVDAGDIFKPAANQMCSFAEYRVGVYERSRDL